MCTSGKGSVHEVHQIDVAMEKDWVEQKYLYLSEVLYSRVCIQCTVCAYSMYAYVPFQVKPSSNVLQYVHIYTTQ